MDELLARHLTYSSHEVAQLDEDLLVKKIGLTGGMGSGKSTVASVFSALDVPVYDSDTRAKQLYYVPEVKKQLVDLLGTEAYRADDGSLNKDWVAQQVFSDPDRLARLNALIHPLVAEDFSDWCSGRRACTYVLKEAAILIESGAHKGLDALIVVEADRSARLQRISNGTKWTSTSKRGWTNR